MAAARKLLPLSHEALESCLKTVKDNSSDEDGDMILITQFGSLCDAAVKSSMEKFDVNAGCDLLKESNVARRIKSSLAERMYSELEELYEEQLIVAHDASFESFKSSLSKLRLSPNLASDMDKVATKAIKSYIDISKTIRSKKGIWRNNDVHIAKLKKEMKEYIHLRLQAARVGGKFVPIPRKGVTLGFHWLMPKPFGNDYRMEPWQVHATDDLVYIPKDKITDVRKDDVMTGDWRNSVIPCPTANEMMYLK